MTDRVNKIIGFYAGTRFIELREVDIFSAGLSIIHREVAGLKLSLWGIGSLEDCKIDGAFSLSFPLTASTDDRNVMIRLREDRISIENDWLGSIPVFYSETIPEISTLLPLCSRPHATDTWDFAGLTDYLEAGYSLFGFTPLKGIRFLRYASQVDVTPKGVFVQEKSDPDEFTSESVTHPEEALRLIREYLSAGPRHEGQWIVPTSGGFDSRLLNALAPESAPVHMYTYGLTENSRISTEAVHASELAKRLHRPLSIIEIRKFNRHLERWCALFGVSTHAHGMYQIEFYNRIRETSGFVGGTLLSGIIGDLWAGAINIPTISTVSDLKHLIRSHGIRFPCPSLYTGLEVRRAEAFISKNREALKCERYRQITLARFKLILLTYLISLPDYFGWPAWSPFLNRRIAKTMLSLPADLRRNRLWQVDFFRTTGISFEEETLRSDPRNSLNRISIEEETLPPLNARALSELIPEKAINDINIRLRRKNPFWRVWHRMSALAPLLRGRFQGLFHDAKLQAYFEYLVLKPLEIHATRSMQDFKGQTNAL